MGKWIQVRNSLTNWSFINLDNIIRIDGGMEEEEYYLKYISCDQKVATYEYCNDYFDMENKRSDLKELLKIKKRGKKCLEKQNESKQS